MEDPHAIIFAMQCLRHAHRFARLVLVWFVMAIGVVSIPEWMPMIKRHYAGSFTTPTTHEFR